MAYRPDDLYNTGINTIGTDLGLGNIQGQNIQVADASIEALLNKERERIGKGPTKVKETFPRFLADEYGTYKSYMGGPGATQLIVDEYQGTFPSLLNVPIKDLQERFDIGLENPDLMQVKKDDYETPYDFSNIEDHLASRDQSFVPRSNIVSRFKQHQLMNRRKQDMQQRIREAEAAAAAKAKADAAADARKKQRMSDKQYDDWRRHNDAGYNKTADEKLAMTGGTEEWGEDMMGGTEAPGNGNVSAETGTDWGPSSHMIARGGLAQHAPRYANGGLIDFFRYGGFI